MKFLTFLKKAITNKKNNHLYLLVTEDIKIIIKQVHLFLQKVIKQKLTFFFFDGNQINKKELIAFRKKIFQKKTDEYYIYFFSSIDSLSSKNSNFLLKFLEEPPQINIIGFLLTNNLNQVLPTIYSRSQIYFLNSSLNKKKTIKNFREIIFFFNKEILYKENEKIILLFFQFFKKFFINIVLQKKDFFLIWFIIKKEILIQEKELLTFFLNLFLFFFKEILNFFITKKTICLFLEEDFSLIRKKFDLENIKQAIQITIKTIKKINIFNINYNLIIQTFLFEIENNFN